MKRGAGRAHPRVNMVAIDIEDDFATNRQIVLESRFSRIPVYRESSDNIIGILHTRDFLEAMLSGSEAVHRRAHAASLLYPENAEGLRPAQ